MDAKLKFIPAAIGGTYANFVVVGLGIVGLLTEFDLKSLAVLIFWLAVFVTIFVSLKKKIGDLLRCIGVIVALLFVVGAVVVFTGGLQQQFRQNSLSNELSIYEIIAGIFCVVETVYGMLVVMAGSEAIHVKEEQRFQINRVIPLDF